VYAHCENRQQDDAGAGDTRELFRTQRQTFIYSLADLPEQSVSFFIKRASIPFFFSNYCIADEDSKLHHVTLGNRIRNEDIRDICEIQDAIRWIQKSPINGMTD